MQPWRSCIQRKQDVSSWAVLSNQVCAHLCSGCWVCVQRVAFSSPMGCNVTTALRNTRFQQSDNGCAGFWSFQKVLTGVCAARTLVVCEELQHPRACWNMSSRFLWRGWEETLLLARLLWADGQVSGKVVQMTHCGNIKAFDILNHSNEEQ